MKKLIFVLSCAFPLLGDDTSSISQIERGWPLNASQIAAGISKSSRFEISDTWGFGFTAKFNEFSAMQDSMEVATTPYGPVIGFDSDYKPGFNIGFVLNTPYDHFNFSGDYLWFQSKVRLSASSKNQDYLFSPLFSISPYDLPILSLESSWNLQINVADLTLSRPYYSGKSLSIVPSVGLKTAFIAQDFDLSAIIYNVSISDESTTSKSTSWGVGPKIGAQSNYLLGYGFTLFGDLSTSLLYTTFTKLHVDYQNSLSQSSYAQNNNANLIQPIIDAAIGFGYGDYLLNDSFYMNLQVSYNFTTFFSQNMMRALVATATSAQAVPANLYLQGVSVGLSFLF